MEKTPKSRTRVRFQDCDPFNHLNNSKYIDYFINAREDQLLEYYGLDIFEHIRTTGKGWVVASNQIMYLKPALVMEEVVITSQLIASDNRRLTVEMQMWNAGETELKALMWVRFLHCDVIKGKIADHSDELIELFSKIELPGSHEVFEERCAELLKRPEKPLSEVTR